MECQPRFAKTGFTLVEAIIVIAIFAILAFVSGANYTGTLSYKRAAASAKILSDIQYAQSLAMLTRQTCGLIFNNEANTYTVFENGDPEDPAVDPVTQQDYIVVMNSGDYAGVTVEAYFAGVGDVTNVIQFDREGIPSDGNGDPLNPLVSHRWVIVLSGLFVVVQPNTGRVDIISIEGT